MVKSVPLHWFEVEEKNNPKRFMLTAADRKCRRNNDLSFKDRVTTESNNDNRLLKSAPFVNSVTNIYTYSFSIEKIIFTGY